MKEGEIRKQVCKRRNCEVCGERADWQVAFLLPNCRTNPKSKAYGKDDCSWCSDDVAWVCEGHHKDRYKMAKERDMEWAASFPADKFPHLVLFWETVKE